MALEKPALLIPIPWVSHNEQYKNAKVLEKYGLAKIFDQAKLTPQTLVLEIKGLLSKLNDYKLSDPGIKEMIIKNSSEIIVNEVYKTAKK